MKRGSILAAALLVIPTAAEVRARPTLNSAEMTSYRGFNYASPSSPGAASNTVTPGPFPNDAQNFAGSGTDGLRVVVNRTGVSHGNFPQNGGYSMEWEDYAFSVVFDVPEASPFTYHRTLANPRDGDALLTLQPEGGAAVPLGPFGDTTGILQAGRYTFAGDTRARFYVGTTGFYSRTISFTDTRLTVVPEPGALSLLALPLLCLRRRR